MSRKLDGINVELRRAARFVPRSLSLHRGLTAPRALMGLIAVVGKQRGVEVATVNPHVRVRVHRPEFADVPTPAMLWIHGGACVMGSAVQDDKFGRKLVNFVDAAVVSVEHRLAPEHPYPIPLEDCYAALLWLARQPWVDANRIALGGASGGGGFAAALAHLARDRNEVKPVLQMLVYPMLDDRTGPEADRPGQLMWTGRDNQIAWQHYIGTADRALVAAARRDNFDGLPPAWIGVGTRDLFYDECVAYSKRLRDAGIPTHEVFVEGAFHGFDLMVPKSSVSERFFASQVRALRAALVESSSPST
jgi:acetyl esterase/lipase